MQRSSRKSEGSGGNAQGFVTVATKSGSARIVTAVEPDIRNRMAAASGESVELIHAESLDAAVEHVRRDSTVSALLVSPHRLEVSSVSMATLRAKCPGVLPVVVVTDSLPIEPVRLLGLGACGVRYLVDVGQQAGWVRLRKIVAESGGSTATIIISTIATALEGPNRPIMDFFEILVRASPRIWTVGALAGIFEVPPTTMMSRFARAGLPSPRDILVMVRLVLAAAYFDANDRSIGDVSYRLGFASPQSFGRHLRWALGITASEFRARYPFNVMLARFIDSTIAPNAATWRCFEPLANRRE